MKGIVVTKLGGPEFMEYQELEMPTVSSKQVFIRVTGTSVNYADIKSRLGKYHGASQPPFVPGLDVTGIIEEVGSEVHELKKGQRVIAFPSNGTYAEYVTANELLTFPISDNVENTIAAASPLVSFTSYSLLKKVAQIEKNETVLIHSAAGGIGTTAIQLAKLLGAKKVIGTVSDDAKKNIAYEAGADDVMNYQTENFVEKVNEVTAGNGADVILDSSAGHIFEQSLECLARFGRIVNYGNATGNGGQSQTNDLHSSCRSILGFSFGTTLKFRPETVKAIADGVLPFINDGQLKLFIGETFALKDAAKAHAWIESRKSTGKAVLIP